MHVCIANVSSVEATSLGVDDTLYMRLERLELLSEEVLKLALNLLENLNSLLADFGELILDRLGGHGTDSVATLGDDLGVVCASTTVPGQNVGGVTGDVGQGILGGDGEQASLELGRADCLDGVSRINSRLEREQVGQESILVLAFAWYFNVSFTYPAM